MVFSVSIVEEKKGIICLIYWGSFNVHVYEKEKIV